MVKTIEIARRMAQLGETKEALRAYAMALNEEGEPAELLEAAAYTLQNGGDYKIAYTTFVALYRAGHFRDDIFALMTQAFYEPNINLLKKRYDRNCKLLAKYPYIFRKDFLPFDALPLKFYPYDDKNGYVPFDTRTNEFRAFVNVKDPTVSRNFFKDLEKPILASDVYSQYELEYLNDNVRPSEWCARENHIYLHYTDWAEFCSWLQVLSIKPLVESKKAVFLTGDELSEYPIDFKARFGIDYSAYTPRPIGVREINKLIWHTQFSSHNGGDFFNEVFDAHPNLIFITSVMQSSIENTINRTRERLAEIRANPGKPEFDDSTISGRVSRDLYRYKDVTEKDLFVGIYMSSEKYNNERDPTSRIAPALFFQPHFHNVTYQLEVNDRGDAVLHCPQLERLHQCEWFRQFKYIKTFTPLRRPTTSYGGTVRFSVYTSETQSLDSPEVEDKILVVGDTVSERVLNRGYLRDPDDRFYHDAVIVRFEDSKLDPEATFTRLAAFLDLPYTETMTYCSFNGERGPKGAVDFDTAPVYRNYDEFVGDNERRYIEFLLRDIYEYYGYDFQTYDGGPVDLDRIKEWVGGFSTINGYMRKSWRRVYLETPVNIKVEGLSEEALEEAKNIAREELLEGFLQRTDENRIRNAEIMLKGLRFFNRRSQPLRMTPLLEPDPALMKNPRYH